MKLALKSTLHLFSVPVSLLALLTLSGCQTLADSFGNALGIHASQEEQAARKPAPVQTGQPMLTQPAPSPPPKRLETCSQPMGSLALQTSTEEAWHRRLVNDHRLPSSEHVVHWLARQSNCFTWPDSRTAKKKQRAAAKFSPDFTLSHSVVWNKATQAQPASAMPGTFYPGPAVADKGGANSLQATITLTLTQRVSKARVSSSHSTVVGQDKAVLEFFNYAADLSPLFEEVSAYPRTPEGRLLAGAMLDSFNQMIRMVKEQSAQARLPRK